MTVHERVSFDESRRRIKSRAGTHEGRGRSLVGSRVLEESTSCDWAFNDSLNCGISGTFLAQFDLYRYPAVGWVFVKSHC
jgi:hypothetical protein